MEHAHDHGGELGGLVAEGLSWGFITLVAAVSVVITILLVKYLVVKMSPRRLCNTCNRYYSTRKGVCPFCGAEAEAAVETAQTR